VARGSVYGRGGSPERRSRRRVPDGARLVERFKRLAPQQAAFKLALRPFCDDDGHFDRRRWEKAFTSSDPARIVSVAAATGLYVGLVNHLVEMLHVAARLRGLDVTRNPTDRPCSPRSATTAASPIAR